MMDSSTPEARIIFPREDGLPEVHVQINRIYALYHFLAREARLPPDERNPSFQDASQLIAIARFPRDIQGHWSDWEIPLTTARRADDVANALIEAMHPTADYIGRAMMDAAPLFERDVWPAYLPLISTALETLRQELIPHWVAIVQRHTALLDLTWPDQIDAFLVPVSYEWRGGYSHPLTISASANPGLALCETLLHEATHVADVHGMRIGHPCLGRTLMDRFRAGGLPFQRAFNLWHAVIFAASADGIRHDIDLDYRDYALQDRDLYAFFGAPQTPDIWRQYVAKEMTWDGVIAALAASG